MSQREGCYVVTPRSNPMSMSSPNRMDRIAIMLSGLCLLHCLFIPVIVVLAPAFSSVVLGTETTVHWIFLALAVPVSCWALLRGYRRSHRRVGLAAGLVGLIVMFLGVSHLFDPALEVPLTVLGVSLVVVAHALNLRGQWIA